MEPFLAITSGLIAAFTPCVVVLIPLVLYTFFNEDNRKILPFSLFVVGFILSYLLFGYIMGGIFSSDMQNGFRLGLGILFVVLGVLSFAERINPQNITIFRNSLLAGAGFALLVSFNPCTIPYLSILIAADPSSVFVNLSIFGIGLLIPSLLFAFVGQSILNLPKKGSKLFHRINKLMSIILIASGIYLALSIKSFGVLDSYMVAALLVIVFAVLVRSFFIISKKKDFLKLKNIVYIASLLLIILATVMHCNSVVEETQIDPSSGNLVCSMDLGCEACSRCINVFSIATALGVLGTILAYYFNK
jgi:cytochrome c biogenesis protein CcdA